MQFYTSANGGTLSESLCLKKPFEDMPAQEGSSVAAIGMDGEQAAVRVALATADGKALSVHRLGLINGHWTILTDTVQHFHRGKAESKRLFSPIEFIDLHEDMSLLVFSSSNMTSHLFLLRSPLYLVN